MLNHLLQLVNLKQELVTMALYDDHINIQYVWEAVLCLGIRVIMLGLWDLGQIPLLNGFDLTTIVVRIMDIILPIVTSM
jgi:hypothetical protein